MNSLLIMGDLIFGSTHAFSLSIESSLVKMGFVSFEELLFDGND